MSKVDQTASEKTYRAIGRFVFEFSQLEYAIRHYLAQEIRLDEGHFSAVVESYDVAVLCNVAIEVFKKSREEKLAAQIRDLINRFRDLNQIRNRVAHGLWVPFRDGGTVHHVQRSSLQSKASANQAESLEKLADEASKLRAELEHAFTTLDF